MASIRETIEVDFEQLQNLLFAGITCDDNERNLLKIAQYKVIKKSIKDGVFYPEKYKKLFSMVVLITKNSKNYKVFQYDFEHFNPLKDYSYEFLAESRGEYAVMFTAGLEE